MARSLSSCTEEIVREFYASYVETLKGVFERRAKPVKHDPLTKVLVQGCWVDISFTSIRRLLYGGSTYDMRVSLTLEFDYQCNFVKSV